MRRRFANGGTRGEGNRDDHKQFKRSKWNALIMRMDGKVAIVTGGSRGIGEAIVRLFCKEGAKVTIGDILEDRGLSLERELNQKEGSNVATFCKLDVSSESDWVRAVEETVKRFGSLNVLVNNAGISDSRTRIESTPEESWEKGDVGQCERRIPRHEDAAPARNESRRSCVSK